VTAVRTPFPRRRLLVAVDASAPSLAALDAAAGLAAALGAELAGLFVEDDALAELARIPLALFLDPRTGEGRSPGPAGVRRELRILAGRARRAVEVAAARAGIRSSFRVEPGGVVEGILRLEGDADAVFLGCSGWPEAARPRLGRTARTVAVRSRRSVFLARERAPRGPAVVLHGDGEDGLAALAAAAALAGREGVVVLVPAGDREGRERAIRDADALAAGSGLPVRRVETRGAGPGPAGAAVRAAGGSVLVAAASAVERQAGTVGEWAAEALRRAGCPVLVVRRSEEEA
jgi:nucleotide-binding universal stress UspA family protein